jgi:hypothetical protein
LKDCSEEASCSRCANRTSDMPHVCTWNNAELTPGLADAECPGFVPSIKVLRAGKAGTESPHTVTPVGDGKRVGGPETPVDKPPKTTRPKTEHSTFEHERQNILQALKTKQRGSVVLERVRCGKTNCRCSQGHLHGPYRYWHYYEAGKVRRKYLGRGLVDLVSKPARELEHRLRELEDILGQGSPSGSRPSETSSGGI